MTSIKRLIDKLLDNWIAKVVSLFIAILLYVFYQASLIDKKTFVIPLKIVEDGIVMHVGKVQNYVPVVIRTNDTIMNMINPSDFEGIVDISYITEAGNYTLPIKISLLTSEFNIYETFKKNSCSFKSTSTIKSIIL